MGTICLESLLLCIPFSDWQRHCSFFDKGNSAKRHKQPLETQCIVSFCYDGTDRQRHKKERMLFSSPFCRSNGGQEISGFRNPISKSEDSRIATARIESQRIQVRCERTTKTPTVLRANILLLIRTFYCYPELLQLQTIFSFTIQIHFLNTLPK